MDFTILTEMMSLTTLRHSREFRNFITLSSGKLSYLVAGRWRAGPDAVTDFHPEWSTIIETTPLGQ